jgi:hypothetical protein
MNHQPNIQKEWTDEAKWMRLILASAPPGWVGVVWEDERVKIVATGEDEESTRMAARTSGYRNAVLIHVPSKPPNGGKQTLTKSTGG